MVEPTQTGREILRAAARKLNTAHATGQAMDCQGMPPGFESPCGVYAGPHGPHTVEPSIPLQSMAASRRLEAIRPTTADMDFLIGWITSANPAALMDALDALDRFRERPPGCSQFHAHGPHGTCRGISLEQAYSAQASE